jgi:hypothetical protein
MVGFLLFAGVILVDGHGPIGYAFSVRLLISKQPSSENLGVVCLCAGGFLMAHAEPFGYSLSDDLLAHVLKSVLLQCPNLEPGAVQDVIVGCAMHSPACHLPNGASKQHGEH